MDNAPSTTLGVGDAAATSITMIPSTTTFDFSFTFTPADFAPTCRPHPRPWNRVPVPAASVYITLRKIWKRVGAVPLSRDHARYLKTTAELHADGRGPRKVPRTLLHVPVWGDATWSEAGTEDVPLTVDADMPAEVTAHEHTLSNVSRKRNSQRQPIALRQRAAPTPPAAPSDTTSGQVEAAMTVPSESPVSPTAPSSSPDTDELPEETTEHITKRVKRRMSRRISILPQSYTMSPAKQTAPTPAFESPVKRRVSFFVLDSELPMAGASPTKTISPSAPFEPVLASSPVKASAAIQSPNKLDTVTEESDDATPTVSASIVSQPHVVVFTQPTAEIEAESPQQVRRRMALHNTRRRETWLATTYTIDSSMAEPNSKSRSSRRHSFLPGQRLSAHKPLVFESTTLESSETTMSKASSRRHTIQPGMLASLFSTTSEFTPSSAPENVVPEISVSDVSDDTTDTVEASATQDETVVVDARTNLDIFGSGPPLQVHSSSVNRRVSLDLEAQTKSDETKPAETDRNHLAPESAEIKESQEAKSFNTVETSESVVAKAIPLSILEEDSTEFSNNSTPRDFSPDMDTVTTDGSREITDEQSLVSRKRTSLALDDSLLLPLPDMTGTETMDADVEDEVEVDAHVDAGVDVDINLSVDTAENKPAQSDDGWQSPTSAELDLLADLLDTPSQPEPVDMSISPVVPEQLELDAELHANDSDDDAMDDGMDDVEGDADEIEDDFNEIVKDGVSISPKDSSAAVAESKVQFESQVEQIEVPLSSDNASPSDDDDDELDLEQVDYTVTQPIHMLQDVNDEVTMTMTMDLDALVEEQLSSHEDSETEMLRKFVTRVKADKSAKAKAAAAAAACSTDSDFTTSAIRARNTLRSKRRSGSMGSTASASGSPIAKKEMKDVTFEKFEKISSNSIFASPFESLDANRTPLGMKDSNMSPSPRKKRKELSSGVNFLNDEKRPLRAGDHVDLLSKPSFDDHSPPRQKRRRKKMEADTGSIFNPEFISSSKDKDASKSSGSEKDEEQSGPRRSKRTRSNQTPVKSSTAGTSANGVLSLIPVRLPGSLNLNGEDSYGLSATSNTSLGARRNDEKDLATMTRVNTRKNKAGSDPPSVVIQRLSQERAQEKWRAMVEKREQREQREREGGGDFSDPTLTQKSIFDSPLKTEVSDEDSTHAQKPRKSKPSKKNVSASVSKPTSKGKSVRWAEVLARFQETTSEQEAAPVGDAALAPVGDSKVAESESTVDSAAEAAVPIEATAPAVTPAPAPATAPITTTAAPEPEKKSIPRRTTRVSRLPPPTPSKVIASAAAAKAAASSASSASSAATTESTPGLKAPRMVTRRAKIVGMGLAANGTPAPKRRTTRTT